MLPTGTDDPSTSSPPASRPGRHVDRDGQPGHRHRLRAPVPACSSAWAPRRSAGPRCWRPRPRSVVVIEVVQVAVLVPVGAAARLGVRRDGLAAAARWPVVLGTVAFAGIGLLMAGTLRGEVNLAAANGLYLVLLLLGGMVIPLDRLPGTLEAVAKCLPPAALSEAFAVRSPRGARPGAWITLVAWAVAAPCWPPASFAGNNKVQASVILGHEKEAHHDRRHRHRRFARTRRAARRRLARTRGGPSSPTPVMPAPWPPPPPTSRIAPARTRSSPCRATSTDPEHRAALVAARRRSGRSGCWSTTPAASGRPRCPASTDYPLDALRACSR